MAVAVVASTQHVSANGQSDSFSINVGAGSDRCLYLFAPRKSADPITMSTLTATYNGVSMTEVFTSEPNRGLKVMRLLAPTSGSNTLAVSWTGNRQLAFMAVALSGVDQGDPDDPYVEESDGGTSCDNATASAVGDLVLDCVLSANGISSLATNSGNTALQTLTGDASGVDGMGVSWETGAASVTTGWSWSGFASFGHWVFNVNASGGGATGNPWYYYAQQ